MSLAAGWTARLLFQLEIWKEGLTILCVSEHEWDFDRDYRPRQKNA